MVKYFTEHANLVGKFTVYSLRIGGATTVMKCGLPLEQIQAIGGWVSDAVQLYMRSRNWDIVVDGV